MIPRALDLEALPRHLVGHARIRRSSSPLIVALRPLPASPLRENLVNRQLAALAARGHELLKVVEHHSSATSGPQWQWRHHAPGSTHPGGALGTPPTWSRPSATAGMPDGIL